MLTISDQAKEKIREFIAAEEESGLALRVAVRAGTEYEFGLVRESERADDDLVIEADGFSVYIDPDSAPKLEDATFEYVDADQESGFRITGLGTAWSDPLAQRVQEVIDSRINPGVASHGGHVQLLDVKDSRAFIKMGGGCQGCGMASVTLKHGIEATIKEAVPEIAEIIDTTEHADGTNPYYSPAKGAGPSPYG